jgi:predicted peroxiredoxin
MSNDRKKLFIMVTKGPEDPEMATIPFVMATSAQASDVEVIMGFQGNGSMLVAKCMPDHVSASGFPALSILMQAFIEAGGKMYVCGPCIGTRKFAQDDLIEGVEIVGGAAFISESIAADQALIY